MQKLATKSVQIGLNSRPFAFVASAAEFQKSTDLFDGDFILWADTENIFTRAAVVGPLMQLKPALTTAFTIIKQTRGDNDYAAHDEILDECEALAWQFLHKMQEDSEPGNACPPEIAMLDEDSIVINRDGPYLNEHYGVTVLLTIHFHNGIPAPDRNYWAS